MKSILTAVLTLVISAEFLIYLPNPAAVTDVAVQLWHLHDKLLGIVVFLLLLVLCSVFYSLWSRDKHPGEQSTIAKWLWVFIPIVLAVIGFEITSVTEKIFENQNLPRDESLEIMVIGHQWWWEFIYLTENRIKVESRYIKNEAQRDDQYFGSVDHPLVLPVNQAIRFLHTSGDVIHAMWIPALGLKKAVIPGFITESWLNGIQKTGLYHGQCAELCGTNHALMPIVVKAVKNEDFEQWVEDKMQQERL